ncbi:MAG: hypothetical protein LUQ71_10170 [Methanoregula sp.]|nr:hypothetical protein [Methanoregula sp.]
MSVFVGDVGVTVKYTITSGPANTGATLLQFQVRKPDGSLVNWPALNLASDTSGKTLYYDTIAGDFDQPGDYRIIPYREFGDSSKHHCDPVFLTVLPA